MPELSNNKVPYISYEHVKKSFGHQEVFSDLNLSISKGEIFSLIGPSGCGKTVTIKMLIGLVEADSGTIFFDGTEVTALRKSDDFLAVRRKAAMVFQGAALFDSMTVYDNIAFPLREAGNVSEEEIRDRIFEKLTWVGLPNAYDKMPEELSGGMKKRVGLARAIVSNPEVILYDEPTAGLDPLNTVRIANLIMSLQEKLKCTSIVVTHDLPVVSKFNSRTAMVAHGTIRAVGKLEDLKNSSDNLVRGFLLGDPTLVSEQEI